MHGEVTLTAHDQMRVRTLHRVLEGALTGVEAAAHLGVSLRQVRRWPAADREHGAAAIPAGVRERVLVLSRTTSAGTTDRHVRDLLAEREGIARAPRTVRRIRRAAEEPRPRQRRPPPHRPRRERRTPAGMLLPHDGSPPDWLEGRGPRLTVPAAIADATGTIAGAPQRDRADSVGELVSNVN